MAAERAGAPASSRDVTLVVPGRNAARTLGRAIGSALEAGEGAPGGIVFVDDGSTDDSAAIARRLGATVFDAGGRGPGAARNVGWRHATTEWIWFIDADCAALPDTLPRLLEQVNLLEQVGGTCSKAPETGGFTGPGEKGGTSSGGTSSGGPGEKGGTCSGACSGVGGSYANAVPESLLACLVHAEIRQRHRMMDGETDYLGSFNVLYRRAALEAAGGFDESWVNGPGAPGAEDADLSYRLAAAGHRLLFRSDAVVAHDHPVSLLRYLRAQRVHGFWGVRLYRRHPGRGRANAYSGHLDHLQPVLALAVLASVPLAALTGRWFLPGLLLALLLVTTLPMTVRLVRRRGGSMLAFAPLAAVRAFARGLGLAWCLLDWMTPGDWRPKR